MQANDYENKAGEPKVERINVGDLVRDRVTGFTGIAVSRHEYITGLVSITVQPAGLDGAGKSYPGEMFGQAQLDIVERAAG